MWSRIYYFQESLNFYIPCSAIWTPALLWSKKIFVKSTWFDQNTFQARISCFKFCQHIARLDSRTVNTTWIRKTICFEVIVYVKWELSEFFLSSFVNLANFFKGVKPIPNGTSMTLFLPQEVYGHFKVGVRKILTDYFQMRGPSCFETKDNFSHQNWNWTFNFSHTSI